MLVLKYDAKFFPKDPNGPSLEGVEASITRVCTLKTRVLFRVRILRVEDTPISGVLRSGNPFGCVAFRRTADRAAGVPTVVGSGTGTWKNQSTHWVKWSFEIHTHVQLCKLEFQKTQITQITPRPISRTSVSKMVGVGGRGGLTTEPEEMGQEP